MAEALWQLTWPMPQVIDGVALPGQYGGIVAPDTEVVERPGSRRDGAIEVQVRGELSPFALTSPWTTQACIREDAVHELTSLAAAFFVDARLPSVVCHHASRDERYVPVVVAEEPLARVLVAEQCDPPLPTREHGEPWGIYSKRLRAAERVKGHRYAFEDTLGSATPWVGAWLTSGAICNTAFRDAWTQSPTSLLLSERGWEDVAFAPLSEKIDYRLVARDDRLHGTDSEGPGGLWQLLIMPTHDFDESANGGHRFPVDRSKLGRRKNRSLREAVDFELPAWTDTEPIPALRALRHVETDYSAVSAEAFARLSDLMGATIESRRTFLLVGPDRTVRRYHQVRPNPRRLSVIWTGAEPPLGDVDTTNAHALHKLFRSRKARTTLPIRAGDRESTQYLSEPSLGGPFVTDAFVAAWAQTDIARAMAGDPDDGLPLQPASTRTMSYRWVEAPAP